MILVITPASSLPHFTITTPLVITEATHPDTTRAVPLAIRILSGLTEDEAGERMEFVATLDTPADVVLFSEPPRFEIECGAATFPDCDVTMFAVYPKPSNIKPQP